MTSTAMIYDVFVQDGRVTAACTVLIDDLSSEYRKVKVYLHRSDFPEARLSRDQQFQRAETDEGFIRRKMRDAFGTQAKVTITPVGRRMQASDVDAQVEAVTQYLNASGFTNVEKIASGEPGHAPSDHARGRDRGKEVPPRAVRGRADALPVRPPRAP